MMLLGVYGCYHSAAPSATIRYKLTLIVDDNGKQYTGSSVVEVTRQDTTKVFAGIGGYGGNYKGEAVAVDMDEKGVLFALLRGKDTVDYPLYIFMKSFPEYFPARADITVIDGMRRLDHDKPKASLPFDKLPMLVRFRDINDPKTVELVDPDDLEKTFGTGVKLVSATIEMTDEGMTSEVEKWLPWLKKLKGGYLHGGFTSREAPLGLYGLNFKTGELK